MSMRRSCLNSPGVFCCICGSYTVTTARLKISDFVKKAYHTYFEVELGDQDKSWAPRIVCTTCESILRKWTKGQRNFEFGDPMIWRDPKDHIMDCYFCVVNASGYNAKNKLSILYPNLESAIRPVPNSEEIPIPLFTGFLCNKVRYTDLGDINMDPDFVDPTNLLDDSTSSTK